LDPKGIESLLNSAKTSTTAPSEEPDGIDNGLTEEPEDGEDGFDFEGVDYGLTRKGPRMAHDITVTFLGTSSGGGPTRMRNCSSLVVDMLGDGTLWSAYRPFRTAYLTPILLSMGLVLCDIRSG
jgi:hypothetical protein